LHLRVKNIIPVLLVFFTTSLFSYNSNIQETIDAKAYGIDSITSISEKISLAKTYTDRKQHFKSLALVNELIQSLQKTNDIKNLAVAYNIKAKNLIDADQVKTGVEFCLNTIPKMEYDKAPYYQEMCLNCGILFNRNNQFKKAYELFNKIEKPNILKTPVFIYNYGLVLMSNKHYDKALHYFKEALFLSKKKYRLDFTNVILNKIATAYILKKEWKNASVYLDSAHSMLQHSTNILDKKEILHTQYRYYSDQHLLSEANSMVVRIEDLNNAVYDYKIQQKTKELSTLHNRKNKLIQRVSTINKELKNTNERKLIIYIILLCICLVMTSLTLLNIYANTKLKYSKIVNEQKLLSSQMTPHFIFNALSILQGMVLNNESKKASNYLSKFQNIMESLVHKKPNTFVSLKEELKLLEDYVDLQNLSTQKNILLSINFDNIENKEITIPTMILQPFVENSIIHGFKKEIEHPTINITFKGVEKHILCIITDNGVGLTPNKEKPAKKDGKSSLATEIVKERLSILSQKMKGNFNINIKDLKNQGKRGVQIIISLPYFSNPN